MKVSYKTLKRYLPDIKPVEEVAQDLIMHTAEVEDIHSQSKDFENIVFGRIQEIIPHENADSLKVCMVDVGEDELTQIVCGGSNLSVGQGVAVAKIGASVLWHGQGEPIVMKKTAIRGVESFGMICAAEEIGLSEDFPAKDEKEIVDLSSIAATPGTPLDIALSKDDAILEVDNKAINHRPDMFSHIGVIREIAAINGQTFDYEYAHIDTTNIPDLPIDNQIPEVVNRYIGLKMSGVQNTESPEEILEVIHSHGVASKGILVDITNYSLYFYGQPTHCFDADKIVGNIQIRYAREGETFVALNDTSYELSKDDIVIADDDGVIALGGVIGGKRTAVSDTTTSIIIEGAHFNHAIVRNTGKRLGVRTDSLNVFEKDIVPQMAFHGVSLIATKLREMFPSAQLESYGDSLHMNLGPTQVPYDLDYINQLIGKAYTQDTVENILHRLGISRDGDILSIPFWRKDITNKSDIAEEVARLDGYDQVTATIPRVNLGAVVQDTSYTMKQTARDFFVQHGFYDLYTYSFVHAELMTKLGEDMSGLIELKNQLSEEQSHMRGSLIPNLLLSLEKNIRDSRHLQLFEVERVFTLEKDGKINEYDELAAVMTSEKQVVYYDMQNLVSECLHELGVDNYFFEPVETAPSYAHRTRSAHIVVRGKIIGIIGEIHPKIARNFDVHDRIGFFSLNLSLLSESSFNLIRYKEISQYQENNFDLSFVVEKNTKGREISLAISKVNPTLIQKVELFDIYEDALRLPGKRSLSFKIWIQSESETLSDEVKNTLIQDIVKKVEKKGGILR